MEEAPALASEGEAGADAKAEGRSEEDILAEIKAKMDTLTSDVRALKATEKAKDKEIDGLWKKVSLCVCERESERDGQRGRETGRQGDRETETVTQGD